MNYYSYLAIHWLTAKILNCKSIQYIQKYQAYLEPAIMLFFLAAYIGIIILFITTGWFVWIAFVVWLAYALFSNHSKERKGYEAIILVLFSVFIARFACESWNCFRNTFIINYSSAQSCETHDSVCQDFNEKYADNFEYFCVDCDRTADSLSCSNCKSFKASKQECDAAKDADNDCKEDESDWSVRSAVDEAGLTIIGTIIIFYFLFYKDYRMSAFLKGVKNLNLFGAIDLELESLEEKIDVTTEQVKKDVIYQTDASQIEAKIENKLLNYINEKSKSNEQTIFLLNAEINKLAILISDLKDQLNTRESEVLQLKQAYSNLQKGASKNKYYDRLLMLGKNILILLELIWKKLSIRTQEKPYGETSISIARQKIESKGLQKIQAYVHITQKDENGNHFPLDSTLGLNNFKIEESILAHNHEKNAKIDSVTPVFNSSSEVYITLVLDCSGSMKGNHFEKSKKSCIDFLNKIKKFHYNNIKVALYFVFSRVNEDQTSTSFGGFYHYRGLEDKIFFDHQEFSQMIDFIQKQECGGGTPLWESLNTVYNTMIKLPTQADKFVFLISDGMDDDTSESTYESAKNIIKKSKIPMIFVGLDSMGEVAKDMLSELAHLSNSGDSGLGTFTNVAPDGIYLVVNSFLRNLVSTYRVIWTPTHQFIDQPVDVSIRVQYVNFNNQKQQNRLSLKYTLKGKK